MLSISKVVFALSFLLGHCIMFVWGLSLPIMSGQFAAGAIVVSLIALQKEIESKRLDVAVVCFSVLIGLLMYQWNKEVSLGVTLASALVLSIAMSLWLGKRLVRFEITLRFLQFFRSAKTLSQDPVHENKLTLDIPQLTSSPSDSDSLPSGEEALALPPKKEDAKEKTE